MPPTSGQLGLKQPIRSWNLTDRRETAYHEAGHAVAARYLRPSHRISKATIIRRGHALGYVQQKPLEERTSMYARWIETQIMVSLAGHVVENTVPRHACRPARRATSRTRPGRPSSTSGDSRWARRKIIVPMKLDQLPPIGPVARRRRTSCSTSSTRRPSACCARRKPAIHHLAKALIERDELIGDELEEVFAEVETAAPGAAPRSSSERCSSSVRSRRRRERPRSSRGCRLLPPRPSPTSLRLVCRGRNRSTCRPGRIGPGTRRARTGVRRVPPHG